MPCIFQWDISCAVLRKKMKEALEKCSTNECSETRRLLLNFVIHNMRKPDPSSSMQETAMEKMPSTWDIRNPFYAQVEPWYKSLPEDERKPVEIQRYFPEYALFQHAVNHMIALANDDRLPSSFTANGFISHALRAMNDYIFEIDEDEDGNLYLVNVYYMGAKVDISSEQEQGFNGELNKVRDAIRNDRNLALLYELLKNYSETAVPFDCAVKGGFDDNGDWHTNFMVYVVRGELRAKVIQDVVDDNRGKSDITTVMKDASVSYRHEQKPGDSAAESARRTKIVDGSPIDLKNQLPNQVIADAAVLKGVFLATAIQIFSTKICLWPP
ncbi:unnamed protein product [Sphacelaria rigidula]